MTNGYVTFNLTSGPSINSMCNFDKILPCCKIGKVQPMVIIFINFVDLESPMVHVKFQDHGISGSEKTVLKVLAIYGHGGQLDHVYKTIFIKFCPPLSQGNLHIKFGFDWSEEDV